jgi:hypothetical protein
MTVGRLVKGFPAQVVSASIGLSVVIFSAGWTVAKQLTLPAGERERAAVEAAYRKNKLPIPRESDLVFLIEDFSTKILDRTSQLEIQVAAPKSEVESIEGVGCSTSPGVTFRWKLGNALVENCKKKGGEFFKKEGFVPEFTRDVYGSTGIWAHKSGISAYVVCSEPTKVVNVTVAANPGCGGERVDKAFQDLFLSQTGKQ